MAGDDHPGPGPSAVAVDQVKKLFGFGDTGAQVANHNGVWTGQIDNGGVAAHKGFELVDRLTACGSGQRIVKDLAFSGGTDLVVGFLGELAGAHDTQNGVFHFDTGT